MKTPFENDIFAMIWEAFKNLYPEKDCKCCWDTEIRDDEEGTECFGLTDFAEDGSVCIFIKPTLPVCDCAEIFAHELAHVAVGVEHDHNVEWEKAFDKIFEEYNRIGNEMFDIHKGISVVDGKGYVRDNPSTSD